MVGLLEAIGIVVGVLMGGTVCLLLTVVLSTWLWSLVWMARGQVQVERAAVLNRRTEQTHERQRLSSLREQVSTLEAEIRERDERLRTREATFEQVLRLVPPEHWDRIPPGMLPANVPVVRTGEVLTPQGKPHV